MTSSTPMFSIVIPTYNRPEPLKRALLSCTAQDFEDFEVLIIDDGGSAESIPGVLSDFPLRLTLIRHKTNLGVGPARNSGIRAAHGEWVLPLDDDCELPPGALARLATRAKDTSPEVVNLMWSCVWDDGSISPSPTPDEAVFDYAGFLRWWNDLEKSEWNNCFRANMLRSVGYPPLRGFEGLLHLNLAKRWPVSFSTEPMLLYHQDVPGLTRLDTPAKRRDALAALAEGAPIFIQALKDHGLALRRHAPKLWQEYSRLAATASFLAGNRLKGTRLAALSISANPLELRAWAVGFFGVLGPKTLAAVLQRRQSRSLAFQGPRDK